MRLQISSQLAEQMAAVEQHIHQAVLSRQPLLREASIRLAVSGGKRLRPLFVLLGGSFGTKQNPGLSQVAAAVELLHMATLVHDDIVDNALTRRGEPTVQSKYGKEIAVFTGDFLLTKALWLFSNARFSDRHIDLAKTMTDICEEEVNQFAERFKVPTTRRYLRRIRGKTAALFVLSIVAGARHCGAEEQVVRQLGKYGLYFGMAFQIEDDILDYSAVEADLGKPVAHDIRSGVYTLPLLYALEDRIWGPELGRILSARQDVDVDRVVTIVRRTDALTRARKVRDSYLRKATAIIRGLPDTESRQWMLNLQSQVFPNFSGQFTQFLLP